MSFMFNPHPYDDPLAINKIQAGPEITSGIVCGAPACGKYLAAAAAELINKNGSAVIGLDGYITAPLHETAGLIGLQCAALGIISVPFEADIFKDEETLNHELLNYLPEDRETDPPLLYGKIYHGGYEGLIDTEKLAALEKKINEFKKNGSGLLIVYGNGVLIDAFRHFFDLSTWIDMTPKRAVLNIRAGKYGNLGAKRRNTSNLSLRRAYYVDFECAGALRGRLLQEKKVDFYIAGDNFDTMKLLGIETLHSIFNLLAKYPFRCRPVYLEGVWGGFYIKRLRNLPAEMKNCAWVFDMIPLEISIVADMDGLQVEFPYYCFIQVCAEKLLGEKSIKKFGRYFPVRFNYDDTFHASGNMSIQVHPDEKYVMENNNEFGRQDESYYIVATAQDAKTYIGFRNEANVEDFIANCRKAEKQGISFNHDDFVFSRPSTPGDQFMLPAGTIHASGRNQVILEIGSLTIGSYTYKMYDYMRKDLEGNLRPIHTFHGDKVLRRDFREDWVNKNLVQKRRIIRQEKDFTEYIAGEHDLLYFSLRNAVFSKRYEDDTIAGDGSGRFHVLVLVDGEKILVRSKSDPSKFFHQNYLDMVVVPASFGPYEVINEGVGIVTLHKTMLKDGFDKQE